MLSSKKLPLKKILLGTGIAGGVGYAVLPDEANTYTVDGKPINAAMLHAYQQASKPMTSPQQGYKMSHANIGRKFFKTAAGFTSTFKNVGEGAGKLMQAFEHKPGLGAAALIGGGVVAGSLADNAAEMFAPTIEAQGTGFARSHTSLFDRAKMDQVAAESFAKEMGSQAAQGISGLFGQAVNSGIDSVNETRQQGRVRQMITEDPILSRATKEEAGLMLDAYNTALNTGPTIMANPYAARNFLREVLVTGNGPDHASLKAIAESERAYHNRRG